MRGWDCVADGAGGMSAMSFSTVGVDESRVRKEGVCGSNKRVMGTRGVTCQNKLPEKSQGYSIMLTWGAR